MIFIILLLSVFLADLMLKKYVEENLPAGEEKQLLGGRLIIRRLHNRGAVFGKLSDRPELVSHCSLAITLASLAALVVLLPKKGYTAVKTGLAMVVGGGICNWFDRFHQGYVTDYYSFRVRWKRFRKLVFNLSDLFIFLGTLLILFGRKRGNR